MDRVVDILNPAEMGTKSIRSLPASYTIVDLDITLPPNDAVIHIPAHGNKSHSFPASRSLTKDVHGWRK